MNTTRLSLLAGGALAALLPLTPLCAQDTAPAAPAATASKGPSVDERLAKMKEKLSLTDDQVKALKPVYDDQKTKIDAVRADTTLTKEQKKEKVKSIMDDTKTKVYATLTPEQKAKAEQARKDRAEKKKEGQSQQ
jgi:Spy/CpxP family protein refolding chaperone